MLFIPHILSIYCIYLALQDYSRSVTEKRSVAATAAAGGSDSAEGSAAAGRYLRALETNTRWGVIGFAFYIFHLFCSGWSSIFGGSGIFQFLFEGIFCFFVKYAIIKVDANIDRLPELLVLVNSKNDELFSYIPPFVQKGFALAGGAISQVSAVASSSSLLATDKKKLK